MPIAELKLRRLDRDPGPDHLYGAAIDALLDDLAGGPGGLDRDKARPATRIARVGARLELHEDGPLLQTVVEKLPDLINAAAALITAWCAWKTTQKGLPKRTAAGFRRSVEIKVGDHKYVGRPSPKDAARIARFMAGL